VPGRQPGHQARQPYLRGAALASNGERGGQLEYERQINPVIDHIREQRAEALACR
jgi:hypothetical protein